jgi:hypothetical protein
VLHCRRFDCLLALAADHGDAPQAQGLVSSQVSSSIGYVAIWWCSSPDARAHLPTIQSHTQLWYFETSVLAALHHLLGLQFHASRSPTYSERQLQLLPVDC